MTQYDNTNTGVAFKNDRKTEDWQPEYRGSLNVEGVEYWLDLKIRDGKNGKFFSVKLKRKDRPAGGKALPNIPNVPTSIPRPMDDNLDDIPF
jgi:hypothetical protein